MSVCVNYGPDTPPVVTRDRVKPLEAALKAIMGDRDKTHGEPEDVFAALAALKKVWRKHNKNRKAHGKQHDEAIEGMLLKLARIAQGEPCQMDNYTDVAGYAGNAYELAVAKGKRDALR